MELAIYLQERVKNFSRYNKYSIGNDLRELSREIIRLIIRANSTRERSEIIAELVITCEMMKTTIFFAKEAKAFDGFKTFQHAAVLSTILCKQSEGWLKSSRKGPESSTARKSG